MDVRIVTFPETKVAYLSHTEGPATEHDTVRKLVAWKLKNGFLDAVKHRHYGLHYTNPEPSKPGIYRVDFCLSVDEDATEAAHGLNVKTIPQMRCAYARDLGSRQNNQAARYLFERWLPSSGETLAAFPLIFHYVNVGPNVSDDAAITDVFMPLA